MILTTMWGVMSLNSKIGMLHFLTINHHKNWKRTSDDRNSRSYNLRRMRRPQMQVYAEWCTDAILGLSNWCWCYNSPGRFAGTTWPDAKNVYVASLILYGYIKLMSIQRYTHRCIWVKTKQINILLSWCKFNIY